MSFEAQAWAIKIKCGSVHRKAVLITLATCANEEGVCWPSVAYIAKVNEMSDRTVQRALVDFEDMGLLERESRNRDNGARTSDIFRLKLDVESVEVRVPKNAELPTPPGDSVSPPPVTPSHPPGDSQSPLESSLNSQTPFSPQNSKSITEDDLKAAKWMAERVGMIMPKAKPPNLQQWANDIRLIRTQDGHDHREICKVFDWANKDTRFWWRVILSPRNLRKHFPRLYLEANVFQKPDHERPLCLHCSSVASITAGHRHYCSEHANLIER